MEELTTDTFVMENEPLKEALGTAARSLAERAGTPTFEEDFKRISDLLSDVKVRIVPASDKDVLRQAMINYSVGIAAAIATQFIILGILTALRKAKK